MSSALVYNNAVEAFYDSAIPSRIYFQQGGTVDAAAVGYSNANGYSILPAVYDDSPPLPTSYSTANNYAISGGTVHITRTWVTPSLSSIAVQVNSTSTPSLNGAYSISQPSLSTYNTLAKQVQAFNAFPGGAYSLVINDINGIPHSFTVSAFLNFYNAVLYYSAAS